MAEQGQENEPLRDPWLVAVWPGMGNVALGAGTTLVNQLDATVAGELPAKEMFDVQHIEVRNGVASMGRLPRSLFFEYRAPGDGRDLLIFIGEAQPNQHGYDFCHRLLDYAIRRGVKRVFTFAAMATQLHPSTRPRVFGVATSRKLVRELEPNGVELLAEGQISGLNGVLLAAAAERGLEGFCLLGELPFFAVGIPNPRASQVALEVFSRMAGLELDLSSLAEQAETVERHLLEVMERLSESASQQSDEEQEFTIPGFVQKEQEEQEQAEPGPELDPAARRRIERLFAQAREDRGKAMELKHELDRLGVFDQYEDRFLDLFRKGG